MCTSFNKKRSNTAALLGRINSNVFHSSFSKNGSFTIYQAAKKCRVCSFAKSGTRAKRLKRKSSRLYVTLAGFDCVYTFATAAVNSAKEHVIFVDIYIIYADEYVFTYFIYALSFIW